MPRGGHQSAAFARPSSAFSRYNLRPCRPVQFHPSRTYRTVSETVSGRFTDRARADTVMLTDLKIKRGLKPGRRKHADARGLYLYVTKAGQKVWRYD
jgi:hypothetical protein